MACLAALSLSSCGWLDTDVYGQLNEDNLYKDEETCIAGLLGVYDKLGSGGVYGYNIWGSLDAGTDIMVSNREYNKDIISLYNYNYNNTNSDIELTWKDLYEGINRANDYIMLISKATDEACGGAKNKAAYISEAKALRALYYMNLVAFWGEVPLRLEPTKDLYSQQLAKSSQEDIYAQIISDLTDAEKGCRPADELNTPGRISKTTVQALLARAYMWEAGYPVYADTWDDALMWAREVKKSGLHHLYQAENGVNGYRAMFINMCSNKYDLTYRESMFEVEFYGNGTEQSNETGKLGLYLGVSQGNKLDPDVPYAYAWYNGTRILFRLYGEDDTDQRKWWNFADYSYKTEGTKSVEYQLTEEEKEKKMDGNPGKWRAKYDPVRPWALNNSSINYPVMRYADVLLMIAECANEVEGKPTQEAIDAANEVRLRAGATEVQLSDFADAESFRQFIREERTRELCFEVPRRMELRRHGEQYYFDQIHLLKDQSTITWKDDTNVLVGYPLTSCAAVSGMNIASRHLYFPIPQAELNTNTLCVQNERW